MNKSERLSVKLRIPSDISGEGLIPDFLPLESVNFMNMTGIDDWRREEINAAMSASQAENFSSN
jgi:hypothetical protein